MIYKIQINYKSGHTFEDWFEKFEFKGGTFTWKLAKESKTQQILILGIDGIESIFVTEEKEEK